MPPLPACNDKAAQTGLDVLHFAGEVLWAGIRQKSKQVLKVEAGALYTAPHPLELRGILNHELGHLCQQSTPHYKYRGPSLQAISSEEGLDDDVIR